VLPYLICEQPRFRQRNDLNCFFQQTTPTRPLTKNLMIAEHEILIFLYFEGVRHASTSCARSIDRGAASLDAQEKFCMRIVARFRH